MFSHSPQGVAKPLLVIEPLSFDLVLRLPGKPFDVLHEKLVGVFGVDGSQASKEKDWSRLLMKSAVCMLHGPGGVPVTTGSSQRISSTSKTKLVVAERWRCG